MIKFTLKFTFNVNFNILLEQSSCAFNLINKRLDKTKMHGTTVKKKIGRTNSEAKVTNVRSSNEQRFPFLMTNIYFLILIVCKVKVKCTLVQALRLCTGRMVHRRSRGIVLPFHDHGTRRG
jgi:hypothetical protein